MRISRSAEAGFEDTARAMRSALAMLNRRLRAQDDAPTGLGATGLSLLGRLYRTGPSTATNLATHEHLQPQSLTRTLRALEERELIVRSADDSDRRKFVITITRAGVMVLHRSVRNRERWLAGAMASKLTPLERDVLRLAIPILERLADADDEAEDDDGTARLSEARDDAAADERPTIDHHEEQ